jgi:hypothetical protein
MAYRRLRSRKSLMDFFGKMSEHQFLILLSSVLQNAYLKIRKFQFKPLKNVHLIFCFEWGKHNSFRLKFEFSLTLNKLSFL